MRRTFAALAVATSVVIGVGPAPAFGAIPMVTAAVSAKEAVRTPAQVVTAFYSAVNRGDYRSAWNLGGNNLVSTFEKFRRGYANTAESALRITKTTGQTVEATVTAVERSSDGSQQATIYAATYTVRNGKIVRGRLRLVSRGAE